MIRVRNIKYRFSYGRSIPTTETARNIAPVFTYREVKRGASSSLFHGQGIDLTRPARYSFNFPKRPSRFSLFSPARRTNWQDGEEKESRAGGKRREDGQSKILQRTRSRRRFMDSARSHLKDYIGQTITNRPPFFSRWDWFNSLPYPL